jgi:hypothetical protein
MVAALLTELSYASLTMLSHAEPASWRIAVILLAGITALYLIARPKNITEETLAESL